MCGDENFVLYCAIALCLILIGCAIYLVIDL